MFEVGDMVVCVRAEETITRMLIQVGGVYTVRGVHKHWCGFGVDLEDIYPPETPGHYTTFDADNFRKIRKPSIEIFREIVASVKGNRNVDA